MVSPFHFLFGGWRAAVYERAKVFLLCGSYQIQKESYEVRFHLLHQR